VVFNFEEKILEYVHVINNTNPVSINETLEKAIYDHVNSSLHSLINGMKQKDFGICTISNYTYDFEKYSVRFLPGKKKYVDSGGYSIIKGDVEPENVDCFIQCYNVFTEHGKDDYDYIFSLDISCSLKHNDLNKKQIIFELNKRALTEQLNLIEKDPLFKKKLFFVWQFKTESLYEIWKDLYNKLDLNNYIQNRAIGGMVSLRKMTSINFSPFTGMAFKCFNDYLSAKNIENGFRLHFLGINLPYDRFHIAFLERLFRVLSEGQLIYHSYDSISYSHSARKSKNIKIYDFIDKNKMIEYENISKITENLLEKVYRDPLLKEFILEEIEKKVNYQFLKTTDSFIPLNIYSNLSLDSFFESIIDEYEMVDIVLNANSTAVVEGKFSKIINDLEKRYPNLFGKNMRKNIIENMEYTWTYCNLFQNYRNINDKLDYHVKKMTKLINFEDILK
jgi:hypothetical protein